MPQVTFGLALLSALLSTQAPSLDQVLARAGQYVSRFHDTCPLILADESYVQVLRPYGSTRTDMMGSGALLGQMGTPKVRELRSEYAVVAMPGTDRWLGFRNVVLVDGKTLPVDARRLERTLADLSPSAVDAARTISNESLRQDLTRVPHDINVPTFALTFVAPERQKSVVYTKKDEKKLDGAVVWVIGFSEVGPPLARRQDGTPQPSRGELWVDPATGDVVRTRVVFDSLDAYPDMKAHPERYYDVPRVSVDVVYKPNAGMNVRMPVEVKESFDSRAEVVTCTASYSNFRRPGVGANQAR